MIQFISIELGAILVAIVAGLLRAEHRITMLEDRTETIVRTCPDCRRVLVKT